MERKPNRTREQAPLDIVLEFLPEEFATLQFNVPGPSGSIGGYQKHENWFIANTDRDTLRIVLDPTLNVRTQIYIKHYGGGGPNRRLRAACVPAYRRLGIDLLYNEKG